MKLPNESPLSRIPTPVLVGAWLLAMVLAAACLIYALVAPSGGGEVASTKATPTISKTSLAAKTPTKPAQASSGGAATPVAPGKSTPAPTAKPGSAQGGPTATALPINEKFGYGIQVNGMDDPDGSVGMTKKLGMTWIKQQVAWGSLEYEKGNMDWSGLDRIVRKASKADLKIMLSIVSAPTWSHPGVGPNEDDKNGIKAPPDDLNLYANFVGQVVERYKSQGYPVHAVEVWNEQNLDREWRVNPQKIDAARYVQMLSLTYKKVKAIDPNLVVISGAPSPTGQDNGVNFVDDLKYIQQMVNAGLLNNADCIGIHHNGYNIPPDVLYQDAPKHAKAATAGYRGPFDNPDHSWSFRTTLQESSRIVGGKKPLCITEFGWPSSEGITTPTRPGFEFSKDNTLQDQANYIVQAFQLMKQWGFVKIAFLWNLNFFNVTDDPSTTDNAIYSLLDPNARARPAFDALEKMPKQ
jgi:aryl-phospho-beta-D-glucosidase BglC (GH1 family)